MNDDATETAERGEPRCPECGERGPLHIAYGYPSHEMFEAEERGEIALGGCVVDQSSPTWRCRRCRHEWGSPPSEIEGIAALSFG